MSNIEAVYDNSEVAMAAYANLVLGATNDFDNLRVLVDEAGMSDKQAAEFAARYTEVLAVCDDPSGLQAAVFLTNDNKVVLGI